MTTDSLVETQSENSGKIGKKRPRRRRANRGSGTALLNKEVVLEAAQGRWKDILNQLAGMPTDRLDGRKWPCPNCGGTRRFNACRKSFGETGIVFCNDKCGISGDGFHVLMTMKKWSFAETVKVVAEFLNVGHSKLAPSLPPRVKAKSTARGMQLPDAVQRMRNSVVRNLPPSVTIPDQPIQYSYNDAGGSPVGVVVRWDRSDGEKEIRQLSTNGDGWQCSWKSTCKPLWKLGDIQNAETVYIAEGEKAVEAVQSFGLVATTSAGGSGAAAKSDWSVLDGKRVVIVPDHDGPGRKYRDKAIQLIQQQAPTATVEVADLSECWPEIPETGDTFDWSEFNDSKPPAWFRDELERISKPAPDFENSIPKVVDECPVFPMVEGVNVDSIPELKAEPFPVDVLPNRFRQMAESISQAVGVDVSFAVLPMFTSCSTAIGNSRWVSTKQGNSQPLMLWTAVVGSSGSQKSEPFSHAEEPIREIDSEVIRAWQDSLASYDEKMKLYKLDFSDWKKERKGDMPAEPVKPPRARLVLTDFTYESMVESHAGTPRGITISCEELSAWFGSFDRYSSKGAASPEQARYLQGYDGKSLTSDRISGFRFVPRAFLNVSGTIQPGILAKCFTDESRQNGLASRLWMTYPESIPIRWTDQVVSATAKANYRRLIRDLWELRPADIDSDKWPVPTVLPFNRESQRLFAEFFNQTGQDAFSAAEDAKAAMTKFIGRCARLAGVLHCCEQVNGDAMDAFEVQPETVERAIRISEWSLSEAHRIYRLLTEPDEVRELRQFAGWLRYVGGRMTARDVARNRRDIETTAQAEMVLIQLVKAGLGTWQDIHRSREFVLNEGALSTNAL